MTFVAADMQTLSLIMGMLIYRVGMKLVSRKSSICHIYIDLFGIRNLHHE
jgi:hypothetical protein